MLYRADGCMKMFLFSVFTGKQTKLLRKCKKACVDNCVGYRYNIRAETKRLRTRRTIKKLAALRGVKSKMAAGDYIE